MELIIHDDGTWSLGKLHGLEKLLLERIPEAADPEGCPAAEERLFPHLLGRPPLDDDEETQTDDWKEFVHPGLRAQFAKSVGVVADDLGKFRKHRSKHGDVYSLNVPKAHADQWCGALNQARLVLHERFDLPDPDSAERLGDEEEDDDETSGKWMAMLQSEIYGHIMEFLVTRILWLK